MSSSVLMLKRRAYYNLLLPILRVEAIVVSMPPSYVKKVYVKAFLCECTAWVQILPPQ